MADLTERERAMLTFERQRWNHAGSKETAIRDLFGCTPTRYYQQLDALLRRPEALAAEPQVVKRLSRLRARPTLARAGRIRPVV